jgi:hypothetical protein
LEEHETGSSSEVVLESLDVLWMLLAADVQSGSKEHLGLEPGVDVEHYVDLLDTLRDNLLQCLLFEPPNAHIVATTTVPITRV